MNLQNTLNTDLEAATGNEFSYQVMPFGNGTLNIQNMGGPESTLSGTFSTIQATLSGGESLSIGNGSNGVQTTGNSDSLTFATSNGGSTITSSQIVAGDTLSGSLVINSSGGNASDSDTIDLANYQNLASSVGATATAAAHQLATDMTTAMQGTTGSTYTASISGGVLTIQTSNPVTAPSPASVSFSPDLWDLTGSGFDLGATLAGSLTFTSSGGNAGGSATIDFANYQGLTSSNLATQNAALTQLGSNLTASLGSATGSTYTAMFASDGQLFIMSGNVNERYEVSDSNVTATPVLGTQNVTLTDQDGFQLYTNPIAPGSTVSGMLNIDATGPDGSATASIDLGNSSYSGLFSNGPDSFNAAMNLQNTLNTDLAAATGNEFSYQVMPFGNGTLNIRIWAAQKVPFQEPSAPSRPPSAAANRSPSETAAMESRRRGVRESAFRPSSAWPDRARPGCRPSCKLNWVRTTIRSTTTTLTAHSASFSRMATRTDTLPSQPAARRVRMWAM
jgi:hypothetical protein